LSRRVFVLEGEKRSDHARTEFQRALHLLGCHVKHFTAWDEGIDGLRSPGSRFQVLALDPDMAGFSVPVLKAHLESMSDVQKPLLMLLCRDGGCEAKDVAEKLECGAEVSERHSLYDIGFLVNRLLYPSVMNEREHPRALAQLEVELLNPSSGEKATGQIRNVSAGGLFVQVPHLHVPQTTLDLKIKLPDEVDPVECSGRVAYCHDYDSALSEIYPTGMGIRFHGINASDVQRIKIFIQDRVPRIDRYPL